MTKIYFFIFLGGLLLFQATNLSGQGTTCKGAQPMCSDLPITFPASTNTSSAELNTSALRGCLGSAPNPAWYFLKIGNPGPINIYISQFDPTTGGGRDVDFACWGPFPSNDWTGICTVQLGNSYGALSHRPTNGDHKNGAEMGGYPRPFPPSKMIDCSFRGDYTEWCYIPNAQRGEYYLLCLTNYSRQPANITFTRLPLTGSGVTDCTILPAAAEGDTICYGQDVIIRIPRTKTTEKYNVILPTGGTYPAAKVSGTGAAVSINIPASLVTTLRKGNHIFEVVTWEGLTPSAPIPVTVIVEELDTKVLSYWRDPPVITPLSNKGVPICPGNDLILGFNIPGPNLPDSLSGEVPPRFYEKIGNTTSYIFLGTGGNEGFYKFRRKVNANEFYAVDRETLYGNCKISKQSVRVIKGTTPRFSMKIQDGVNKEGVRASEQPPASGWYPLDRKGQGGNINNDDPTLPSTATVNTDGYWSPLSENPWVKDRGINPIPDRGTLENDKVLYTIENIVNATLPLQKTHFFGFPNPVGKPIRDTLTDDQETTMTGIVVDKDGCEGRKDTTILRLKPPKIKITLTNADTTVCGNDMVEIKARIVSVENDSYFPLTFKWQTIDPETFGPLAGLPKSDPKLGIIGDGGNGNGNGYDESTVTLAGRNDIIAFKVRVGELFKVYAETRALPTGIFIGGSEQMNKFKSSSYFAKVTRLTLPTSTTLMAFEREITDATTVPPKTSDKGFSYFCSGLPVSIKGGGVRDYLWTVNTPDSPTPVVVGRAREVKTSETVNRTPGIRTVTLNMTGYNGCANDTSFKYQILPLPSVTVARQTLENDCFHQKKTLIAVEDSINQWIVGNDPNYRGTTYEAITDKNFEWKPAYNTNPNPPIGKQIDVFPDITQIYAVAYKDPRGCIASWVDTVHAPVNIRAFARRSQYCLGEKDIELEVKATGTTTDIAITDKKYEWVDNRISIPIDQASGKILAIDVKNFLESGQGIVRYANGGWELAIKVTGTRDGTCSGSDTVKVKIRPKPNFGIEVRGDEMARALLLSGNSWKIQDIAKFAIVALKFDNSIKDLPAQYAVETTTDWSTTATATGVTRVDFPEDINNPADTVQKITPKTYVKYKIKVTNQWYNLFVGDTISCSSEEVEVEIIEPPRIEIEIPTPPGGVDITRFGQKIMTVCQDDIENGIKINIIDKEKKFVSQVNDILWYRVKLENGKYIPTHGGYIPTFSATPPIGTLDVCTGGFWPSPAFPIKVMLPTTSSLQKCSDRMPTSGDFKINNSNDYNSLWLDSTSTFALYVKAKDAIQEGYDVLYVTVLPKPKKPQFTIDAPLSAYKGFSQTPPAILNSFTLFPDAGNNAINANYLDSTYNVWCYNQPYSITFTDRSLNYTWSSRNGVRQDLYDEFTYWLSPTSRRTTYTVMATDNFACMSLERPILVHPMTKINISATLPDAICKNDSAVIVLKDPTNVMWYLDNDKKALDISNFVQNGKKDSLFISYQKEYKTIDPDPNTNTIKKPSRIKLESNLYHEPYTLLYTPTPPSGGTINMGGFTCKDSLVLNIETWVNVPEIGALLPEDTVLIQYHPATKSYSLCLGSNPRFDVLTYREARRRGLKNGDERIRQAIPGNTPSNTFFDWTYNPSKLSLDWGSESSWGHIRPLVPHGIDSLKLSVFNWNRFCSDTVMLRIRADEVPKINFSYAPKQINRKNQEVIFKYDNNPQYNYAWNLDIESADDESSPIADPTNPSGVLYYFKDITKNKWVGRVVAAKDDGCQVEIPIQITRGFYIPNTFTPNGDGKNDKFLDPAQDIDRLGLSITDFRFSVFTRRGQKVYEGSEGWDGTYNGNTMPPDVYYYVIEYVYDGEPLVYKGSVTLLK